MLDVYYANFPLEIFLEFLRIHYRLWKSIQFVQFTKIYNSRIIKKEDLEDLEVLHQVLMSYTFATDE